MANRCSTGGTTNGFTASLFVPRGFNGVSRPKASIRYLHWIRAKGRAPDVVEQGVFHTQALTNWGR